MLVGVEPLFCSPSFCCEFGSDFVEGLPCFVVAWQGLVFGSVGEGGFGYGVVPLFKFGFCCVGSKKRLGYAGVLDGAYFCVGFAFDGFDFSEPAFNFGDLCCCYEGVGVVGCWLAELLDALLPFLLFLAEVDEHVYLRLPF